MGSCIPDMPDMAEMVSDLLDAIGVEVVGIAVQGSSDE